MNLHNSLSVIYHRQILENGRVVRDLGEKSNMITNAGMNGLAIRSFLASFAYCAIGTGTGPVRRDSGTITVTIVDNIATASAGFFEADDIGRLLKTDSGQERYVVGFTSADEVTLADAEDEGPVEFTIWYVNTATLSAETKRTNSTVATGQNYNSGIAELSRTFLFPAESVPVVYREVGWSWSSGTSDLFGRDLLPGSGDALAAGQQYRITVRLRIGISPLTPVDVANVGEGWDTTGKHIIRHLQGHLVGFSDDGSVFRPWTQGMALEPNDPKSIYLANLEFPENPAMTTEWVSNAAPSLATADGYEADSFVRIWRVNLAPQDRNGTWNSIFWGGASPGSSAAKVCGQIRMDTPQTKANTHRLRMVLRHSWSRTLAN